MDETGQDTPRTPSAPPTDRIQDSDVVTTPSRRRRSINAGDGRRHRLRVRFTRGGEGPGPHNRSTSDLRNMGSGASTLEALQPIRSLSSDNADRRHDRGDSPSPTAGEEAGHEKRSSDPNVPQHHVAKPQTSLLRDRRRPVTADGPGDGEVEDASEKAASQLTAQHRARRLAIRVGSSAPVTSSNSPTSAPPSPPPSGPDGLPVRIDDIPLMNLNYRNPDDTDSDEESPVRRTKGSSTSEAHHLVRMHSKRGPLRRQDRSPRQLPARSGPATPVTPVGDRDPDDYVPPPEQYRGGILSCLLRLYNAPGDTAGGTAGGTAPGRGGTHDHLRKNSADTLTAGSPPLPGTPGSSGYSTPRSKPLKWYHDRSEVSSTGSLAGQLESSALLTAPAAAGASDASAADGKAKRARRMRPQGAGKVGAALSRIAKPRLEDEIKITVHIAETLSRQKYLLKLCRALMYYGAPTHRLEEYMKMTARVLEIESQFLYIPGCMIISFDDGSTHTTEVRLVRTTQGVDLGKLQDTHEIYKEVVHDVIGVEEATQRLDDVQRRRQKHHPWVIVFVYGLASACVGPFAFQARLIDLPVIFGLGTILGVLQIILAPKSDLYSNVFEISATVLTSFLARALGSVSGGDLFCFSALAQSSIALILPGYTVLCGSLELQSKSLVAGSVRMVYAIIYSLFLGFGITIGTAIYGLIDPDRATSTTQCSNRIPEYWPFIFVPPFTLCLVVINQAKWRQAPVMVLIAFAGYTVNFFAAKRLPSNAQISNTLAAFVIGVLGNLYSRVQHGVAAAAIFPAIFVLVPSSLAASGSLVSGIMSADQLTNGTDAFNVTGSGNATTVTGGNDPSQLNTVVFNVGASMIQIAIGITVGLFLSAVLVYPLGKRRSGLFSF
ncbi:MAG: hypothetical protein M1832_002268 [Thelocarpon impressellum]|nr:MAG: hypothetical protein M1832_002268 [Thelocarpon impressellum]